MSPGATLYLAALLVYLLECLTWVPRGHLALVSTFGHRFRPRETAELFGNQRGGLLFLFPLPPFGRALLVPADPTGPLSFQATGERIAVWRRETRTLRVLTSLLWAYVFVACPLVAGSRGLAASWRTLLLGLLVLEAAVVLEFVLAHRVLFPERAWQRAGRALLLLVSPPAAIRADDLLSRDVLADANPLTATMLLGGRRDAGEWTRRALFDHPEIERAQRAELERLFNAVALTRGELLAPPAARSSDARSFCPRCHAQFALAEGQCDTCRIPLAAIGE